MAARATSFVEFASNGNSKTYQLPGHTIAQPRLAIQRRKIATNVDGVADDSIRVVYGTKDEADLPLAARTSFEVIVRRPANGVTGDVTSALAVFRDVVASDEFTATVTSQSWSK
jgi:hypothetical protein